MASDVSDPAGEEFNPGNCGSRQGPSDLFGPGKGRLTQISSYIPEASKMPRSLPRLGATTVFVNFQTIGCHVTYLLNSSSAYSTNIPYIGARDFTITTH